MRNRYLHSVCISAMAMTGAAWSVPALAQDTGKDDTAEIVVTAQKRTEKLQDISVAAAVLAPTVMEQAHVTDISDINRVVPSVEIKGTFNGRVPYGIRGISTNANEGVIGLTSGVSIQVDGVPVPADSFAANTVSDVAQLEVLKGPQATLGGRAASAGTINFVTFAPTADPRFAFDASLTDDGEYRVNARASGPISDTLSYSLTGTDSRTPYPIENIQLGVKSRAYNYGVRGKLKFEPTSDFDATLMGHYAISKSRGETFVPQYFTPGATLFPFIPYTFDSNGVPTGYGIPVSVAFPGYTIERGNTKYSSPVDMQSHYKDIDGSLSMNYRAGDLTFSSLTSYFREKQYQTQDIFESSLYFFDVLTGGNAPFWNNTQSQDGRVTQWTQEFRIASDPSRPVNFLAGAYYSDTKVSQYALRAWVANPNSKLNVSTTKTYALYGRVTAEISPQFTAVGGLRYNHDKIGWDLTELFNPANGEYAGCGGSYGCEWKLSDSSNALVGDFALQWRPTADIMAYASYTRGYKPKAFNTVHDFTSLQSAPSATDALFAQATKAEKIDSFELGLKSSLLDRHLTFNLAAFHTNYKNYQAQIFDNSQIIAVLVLANAGARTQGVEADLNYVRGNTRAMLSAAYIDAKFTHFEGATCYPTQTTAQGCVNGVQDLSGHSLPSSPKLKVNGSIQQTVPLSGFNLLLGGNVSYRTATNMQANGNPETRQPGFGLLDLSLGFQTKDEKATLTFFVNNVTDHFYLTNIEDFFSSATGTAAIPSGDVTLGNYVIGQPARDSHRYFGGRLSVSF